MRAIALLVAFLAFQCWAADKPKIVFIAGEYEYSSRETLPVYAANLAGRFEIEPVVLKRPDDPKLQSIPNLDELSSADLVVLFVRRMTLPENELRQIKNYLATGKPLVALRTSSHAFENWKSFDKTVLGGNYQNHHGNALKTHMSIPSQSVGVSLLKGVTAFTSDGSLYKNTPLQPSAEPLLAGTVEGHPPEPVAWTHLYDDSRVFYTSLGHPSDFKQESFRNLLQNAIEWALGEPLKEKQP